MRTFKPREKTCKACGNRYMPVKPMQKVCGPLCAIQFAQSERAKKERKQAAQERAEARRRLKTRADYMREAQAAFNSYIRLRDANRPCISCGRFHEGQNHAGHYLSVGANPALRFEPLNVWKQCAPCNTYLSGNAVNYRRALVELIGIEKVEWLEGPHEPQKYTVDELIAIKKEYVAKRKELEKQR